MDDSGRDNDLNQACKDSDGAFQHVIDHVAHTFGNAGVTNYALALSFGGNRKYHTVGEKWHRNDASIRGIQVGCMLRPLVAIIALDLFQKGRLQLDAPIGNFFHELANDRKSDLIKIQHLMSHTPGYLAFNNIPVSHQLLNRESALANFRSATQLFWPGTTYNYDHMATAMLGDVLERITDLAIPELVSELILTPLGISTENNSRTHADFHPFPSAMPPGRETHSLYKFVLTLTSMMRLIESLMPNLGTVYRPPCLSSATLKALLSPIVFIPRAIGTSVRNWLANGYTLGLQVFRNGFLGYDTVGKFQASGFRIDPLRQIAVILVTESRYRAQRRVVLGEVVKMLGNSNCPSEYEHFEQADITLPLGPSAIAGDYFGNQGFSVNVRRHKGDVIFTLLPRRGGRTEIRGQINEAELLFITSNFPGPEPTFFRDSRTGEPCLMFGNMALKQLPAAYASRY